MSVCLFFYIHRFYTSLYGPYVAWNKPDLIWFDLISLVGSALIVNTSTLYTTGIQQGVG